MTEQYSPVSRSFVFDWVKLISIKVVLPVAVVSCGRASVDPRGRSGRPYVPAPLHY